ncbi:glycoside hydrolase family 16 [Grosmannia clavigera kw1407]|uniref:chitinase n=1 Tax=Grosmannia clavigera (strain kw1407 / UAMH 11150) TaxID=655863 RepID=F0XHG4_GROCL|nr:glycoside hydrolase family 16 [Grosmannia clavigera kw1407]EFX02830.1 glycoside hydrolase family 16 [Grosmannia clavigera kw1407]
MHLIQQFKLAAALVALQTTVAAASCNPLESTGCSADKALGTSIKVDFSQGSVNSFTANGSPTYGSDGVTFTITKSGDAPQLNSVFYIMFGHVQFVMKSAPGAGIVSSLVLQSDDLDEIDMEWLGTDTTEVQTNYFGKGETITYNRGQFDAAANNQGEFITYDIDWTADRIEWSVSGTVVRTLLHADADTGQYPQTPMQVKFGAWAGGDTATNSEGTVSWARGPTDFSDGPFSMIVRSIAITDYSTGTEYQYSNQSGDWQSIVAVGGEVGVNSGSANTATATAAVGSSTLSPTIPVGGIGAFTATASAETIPSGWVMTPSGKIVPAASNLIRPPHLAILAVQICASLLLGAAFIW